MKKNKIEQLSTRELILLRPNVYIGGKNKSEKELLFFNRNKECFEYKKISYVEGLLKIIDEIIDNSIDEYIKTDGVYSNNINIKIRNKSIEIYDNGRGIPQELDKKSQIPMGILAFTNDKTGSNFKEEKANGIGANGVGAYLTNIFSKKFVVESVQKKSKLTLKSYNNAETYNYDIKKCKKENPYTKITFYPDFEQFGVEKISSIYEELIYNRLIHIKQTFDIDFKIDGININEKIKKYSVEKYLKLYSKDIVTLKTDNYCIGVYINNDNDGLVYTTYANGLYLKRGGNHIDFLKDKITEKIRSNKLKSNEFRNLKPSMIYNKLGIVCIMREFNNLEFDSQSKEVMTNSNRDIKLYFGEEIELFFDKIIKNKQLIDNIKYDYRMSEELKRKKELKKKDKLDRKKKLRYEKYMPPIKNKDYLVLLEGTSAKNSIVPILGRKNFGYYELGGKPINCYSNKWNTMSKLIKNKEMNEIRSILSIPTINYKEINEYSYKNVLIAADADLDGFHIIVLLLTFFEKFTNLLENNKVKILKTPIGMATNKIGKSEMIMDYPDLNKYDSNWTIEYKKGLGSWEQKQKNTEGELEYLFNKHGLFNFIEDIKIDDDSLINKWMSKNFTEFRKEKIKNNDFNLSIT